MQTITLRVADNGIIKEIKDDNINAGGEAYESIHLYEFTNNESKIKFIHDVCIDIGLDFGNSRQKNQIQIKGGWGVHYTPTKQEINLAITELKNKIEELEKIKS
jgi:hypothetical protein